MWEEATNYCSHERGVGWDVSLYRRPNGLNHHRSTQLHEQPATVTVNKDKPSPFCRFSPQVCAQFYWQINWELIQKLKHVWSSFGQSLPFHPKEYRFSRKSPHHINSGHMWPLISSPPSCWEGKPHSFFSLKNRQWSSWHENNILSAIFQALNCFRGRNG